MPRIARGETLGGIYHIINRGNMKMNVFEDSNDLEYFLKLIQIGLEKYGVELHAYCLMMNHFHLLLVPKKKGSLSKFMQWLMTSQVRYYHKKNGTSGHIWQGRFKSFIIERDSYYLTLIRYIEANALRANMVEKAQYWKFGSLNERIYKQRELLHKPYIKLNSHWSSSVNRPIKRTDITKIRNSINKQTPLGLEDWVKRTAKKLGLESTLNKQGRPKK